MEITLHFRNKTDYNKFRRNLAKGKGTVIKSSMLNGEGFNLGSILKGAASSNLGKTLINSAIPAVANLVSTQVEQKTGSKLLGNLAGAATKDVANVGVSAATGSGLKAVKGSQAAKDKMARIRAMRKGGSFRPG
jgi:hypothetical protein